MAARHRFVLDTRRLVTVVIGLLLVGGLLFTGGFLAGMRRQLMKPQMEFQTEVPTPRVDPLLAAPASPAGSGLSSEPAESAVDSQLIPPTIYELQLGLYLRQLDAERSIEQLAELGYEAYTVPVTNSRGQLLYTVRLGPFESMDEAGAAAREFTAVEKQPAIIRFRRQPVELSAPPAEVAPEQPVTPAAGS